MKVYVLTIDLCIGRHPAGFFSTLKAAKASCPGVTRWYDDTLLGPKGATTVGSAEDHQFVIQHIEIRKTPLTESEQKNALPPTWLASPSDHR